MCIAQVLEVPDTQANQENQVYIRQVLEVDYNSYLKIQSNQYKNDWIPTLIKTSIFKLIHLIDCILLFAERNWRLFTLASIRV